MEYAITLDFVKALQLYQQVHQVLHLVSPTLMNHLGHALDTKAVSLVQGLQPFGAGIRLLLEIQARGFYSVMNTSHQDYVAVVQAARWVIERNLVLPGLAAVPVLVTSSTPTAVPTATPTAAPMVTPAAAPAASQVPSPVPLPVTEPISPVSPAVDEAEGQTTTETAVSTPDTIRCAALLDSPAPQEQATLDLDQNQIETDIMIDELDVEATLRQIDQFLQGYDEDILTAFL